MSSGCRCADARSPMRATYVNLYKWPESDLEFVRAVATGGRGGGNRTGIRCVSRRKWVPGRPAVVDSYSCRQMYLRSYTFTKKESVPERTRRCLGKVRERAALFSVLPLTRSTQEIGHRHQKKKKQIKKGCVVVRKLREASLSALSSLFRRLLSCTTSVDVTDRRPSPTC